jgi:predicted protein tyrosine phosphatase
MIEVYRRLWVGDEGDEAKVRYKPDWWVLHAAKEPYHRRFVGYTSVGADPDGEEYLFARRGVKLALNLVDARDIKYIPDAVLDAGLAFIDEAMATAAHVLVHCNKGESRGPSLALLWLHKQGLVTSIREFQRLYPRYIPGKGMKEAVEKRLKGGE